MSDVIENPRVDLVIARHGRSLLIALVAVGLLSAAAAGWVVATPSTTTVTQDVGQERVATDVDTRAEVVESGFWDDGTWRGGSDLENNPVYLLNASPSVTLAPRTAVPTDETRVVHEVTVRFEAVRNGEVFWEDVHVEERTTANATGGVATSSTSLDVEPIAERKRTLERELAGVGSVTTSVDVRTAYDTGSNAGNLTSSTTLHVTDDAYWFDGGLSAERSHPQTAEVEVTESPNPALVGLLGILAVGSFGAAAFVYTRADVDVESARRAVHERRYAEWISHGRMPMWIGDHQIELDTLADVVDVAIDTNERVVHDRQRGLFAVVSDDVVYYYSDQGTWEETAWPEIRIDSHQGASGVEFDDRLSGADGDSPPSDLFGAADEPSESPPDPDDDDAWHKL